jgi:hypothetical protein
MVFFIVQTTIVMIGNEAPSPLASTTKEKNENGGA